MQVQSFALLLYAAWTSMRHRAETILAYCWATVYDSGPTLSQFWITGAYIRHLTFL